MKALESKHLAAWKRANPLTASYVIPAAETTPRATIRPTHKRKPDALTLSGADEAPKVLVERVGDGE